MPDFIKNLDDCVIVDNRFFCYDEIEKSMKELKEKNDALNLSASNSGTTPGRGITGSKSIAYIKNILHDILNVKENN